VTALPDEGSTTVEEWVVAWFPPDVEQRRKRFTDEAKARSFAAEEPASKWHPLLEHRLTTTVIVAEFVPLDGS
jgi:hypothetical protein